jgi:hypothetical protein
VSDRSKLQMRPVLITMLLAAAAAKPAFADPLADANAAEARGDFAAALPIYRSLAEKGNVGAQKHLGYLYGSAPASTAIGSRRRSGTARQRRPATKAPPRRSVSSDAIGCA